MYVSLVIGGVGAILFGVFVWFTMVDSKDKDKDKP